MLVQQPWRWEQLLPGPGNFTPKWDLFSVGFVMCFCPFQQRLSENGQKYVPPHVRRVEEAVDAQKREERQRLKKQVQGLINR